MFSLLKENRKLKEELLLKEKMIKQLQEEKERVIKQHQEEKSSSSLGRLLEEHMFKLRHYLLARQDVTLTLISVVEPAKNADNLADEGMVGFWYGVKVVDGDSEIFRIRTFLSGDGCFISEASARRRRSYLFLGTLLCQYFKYCIENDRGLKNIVKKIEIKEEINVSKELFQYPIEEEN